ncbi:Two-component response regulator-like APRR1, partial [Tetrabaena socialis]
PALPHEIPKNLRILVIDSKALSRQTTTQLLRECSYQVTAVKTAREGLQLLAGAEHGANFDLVLKEHEPPVANACRLLKRMAKTEGLARTPVVVTSSQDERETVMSCLSLGAIDYLIKPLRQNELRHIWTRVWWWRKSQGLQAPVAPAAPAHAPRHYTSFRGPSSANHQYEAASSDSKQTNW